MARLLVYRPGAIGDGLLAFPALAALRRAFPAAPLTLVANAATLPLARDADLADETYSPDDARLTSLFAGTPPSPVDPALPTHAVLWSGAAADPLATTLRTAGTTLLHTPGQPPPGARQHVADYLVGTLVPFGVLASAAAVPCVVPSPERVAAARAWLDTAAQIERAGGRAPPTLPPNFGGWPDLRATPAALEISAAGARSPGQPRHPPRIGGVRRA